MKSLRVEERNIVVPILDIRNGDNEIFLCQIIDSYRIQCVAIRNTSQARIGEGRRVQDVIAINPGCEAPEWY